MEDVSGCLCAMCCFPCMMMTMATRMDEFCCMPFLVPNALFPMRVQVRAANRIKGTICRDCVMTTCCTLCAACQLKRELDNIDARKPSTDL
ncbi:placenta-specific gene 8 protein-like [Mya arenaria]|uniref:placenta-specific gene 8 protein-like n=1 Tax=Mya arenaria TaxID=6604 RepID=UPI0022DFC131|nr:placenta-specific gene 8 protein-like [Mya arenaria]XP_052811929.1 placenta-specific gene 8 protein-like [Mya arenaria]